MDPTISAVQNYGAMGILALMVWRLPSILSAINEMVQNNVKNVRETQTEALNVFKSENDKILTMLGARFKAIEETTQGILKTNTAMIAELKGISIRVGELERDKSEQVSA